MCLWQGYLMQGKFKKVLKIFQKKFVIKYYYLYILRRGSELERDLIISL